MKKGLLIFLGVVLVIGIGLYSFVKNTYNNLVVLDEGVQASWSQVENQYQRRADLIPNLVATVKGVADFEKETYTAVTEARANATKTDINVKDAAAMAEFQSQQSGISSALSRLLVAVENYPQLKANENFKELQVQLEGTENRISTERMRFNETVKVYNVKVRQFPTNILAGIFGFEKANLFAAEEGADTAPEVAF